MMKYQRLAGLCGFAALVISSAQAITFSNVQIQSPPLSNGSSFSVSGNAISFFLPNAIVGDAQAPLRSGTLNIQYDVAMGSAEANAVGVFVNLGALALGSGTVDFIETVIELDGPGGNEVDGGIGTSSHHFDANTSPFFDDLIQFNHSVRYFRAKKAFVLTAVDTNALDEAGVALVNQNVMVPEPATIAGLALGALALARRTKRKS